MLNLDSQSQGGNYIIKKYLLMLVLALFCASASALSGTNNSTSTADSMSKTAPADQINESSTLFTLMNLTKLGEDNPIDPMKGINISQVVSGRNASANLIQASPGAVIRMHYHKYRDEITYVIKGQVILTVSGKNYTSKAGDLMYIPAMTLHRIAMVGNETVQAVSMFTPTL